jgi:hypothetical protein
MAVRSLLTAFGSTFPQPAVSSNARITPQYESVLSFWV